MIIALLVASLLSAAAPIDKRCEPLRTPLRVRLTIATGEWRGAEPVIRRLVEDSWQPTGLQIDWVDDPGAQWNAIDFWIAVVHTPATTDEDDVLGFVRFDGDQPNPLARVSIDAALMWAQRYHARRLKKAPGELRRLDDYRPDLVHRVLGYTAAHEMGHFVLATKSHAWSGLMKASYRQPETMSDPKSWRLDGGNVLRLRQRIAGACVAQAP